MMNKAFLSNEPNPTLFMARYLLNENNKNVPEFQQEEIARLNGLLAMSKKREEEQLRENEELRRRFDALVRQQNKPNTNPVRVQTFKNDTPIHVKHSAVALSTSAPQSYEQRQPRTSKEKPVVIKRRTNSPVAHNGESSQISKRQRLSLPKTLSGSSSSSSGSSSSDDDEKRAATSKTETVDVPPSVANMTMLVALGDSASSEDGEKRAVAATSKIKAVDMPPSIEASVLFDSWCNAFEDKPANTSNTNSVEEPPSVGKSVLEEVVDSLSNKADDDPVEIKSVDASAMECAEGADGDIQPQASSHIKRENGSFKLLSTDDFEPDYEGKDVGEE